MNDKYDIYKNLFGRGSRIYDNVGKEEKDRKIGTQRRRRLKRGGHWENKGSLKTLKMVYFLS